MADGGAGTGGQRRGLANARTNRRAQLLKFRSVFAAAALGGALLGRPAWAQPAVPAAPVSVFAQEQQMGFGALMRRWDPLIVQASRRFDVPEKWIRIVMPV